MKRVALLVLLSVAATLALSWWRRGREPVNKQAVAVLQSTKPVAQPTPVPAVAEALPVLPLETESERQERLKSYGDIPREKLSRVRSILKDYAELERKLWMEKGVKTPNDGGPWREFALLDRERRADLEKILTPREAEDCDMHWTQAGKRVLNSLGAMPVSDDERRALFRLQHGFEAENRTTGVFTAEQAAARESARLAAYDQMRVVLGAERFAVYLAQDDPGYKRFLEITEQQGRPVAVADELWRIKSEYWIRAGQVSAQFAPDAKAKMAQYLGLHEETRARVIALVGETAVRERTAAFSWLPKPMIPPAP